MLDCSLPGVAAFQTFLTGRFTVFPDTSGRLAWKQVDEWLALPNVWIPIPSERHGEVMRELIADPGVLGNLVSDAHRACIGALREKGFLRPYRRRRVERRALNRALELALIEIFEVAPEVPEPLALEAIVERVVFRDTNLLTETTGIISDIQYMASYVKAVAIHPPRPATSALPPIIAIRPKVCTVTCIR